MSVSTRSTDRRRIQLLTILQLLGIVAALIAIVILVVNVVKSEQARRDARFDNCRLLQQIIRGSTPAARLAQSEAFLLKYHLNDCHHFAEHP